VGGADSVTVTFYNGIERHAEVVGTDPDSDLAVIRVQNVPAGVHSLPLADSDQVKVGEWVIAIGSPFGLGASMSTGIVSATGRTIPAGATPFSIPHAIQTDAAINPGNSGGPLINMAGAVIGINAQIATGGTEQSSGVGFAIPSNIARRVVPSLIQSGEYRWPWLGVTGSPLTL
jgi:2-alkenal reductase